MPNSHPPASVQVAPTAFASEMYRAPMGLFVDFVLENYKEKIGSGGSQAE